MTVYLDLLVFLNFSVDFLLLVGASRLCGEPANLLRCALAAGAGGIYAGACLVPGVGWLGSAVPGVLALAAVIVIAYGPGKGAWKRGALFLVLTMALGGMATLSGARGFWGILAAAMGVFILCIIGFSGKNLGSKLVKIELLQKGVRLKIMALWDTGNQLKDPVTGQRVVVAGADIANKLLGLTEEELKDPVKTMLEKTTQKLQLIPYHAVGQERGMLLAVKMDEVRVNGAPWGGLVAFAPHKIANSGEYQALVGGVV